MSTGWLPRWSTCCATGALAARLGAAAQIHVREHFAVDRRIATLGDILVGAARLWSPERMHELVDSRGLTGESIVNSSVFEQRPGNV